MARTETEVKAILIDYTCDKCGKGKMRMTAMLASNPPKYVHMCQLVRFNRCDSEEELRLAYKLPHTQWVPVE